MLAMELNLKTVLVKSFLFSRTIAQTIIHVVRQDSVLGLWRGLTPVSSVGENIFWPF